MSIFRYILIALIAVSQFNCATVYSTDPYEQTIEIFRQSPQVAPFFRDSYGYAVFPTIGKGAIVVGGAYGKGQVYRQGLVTGSSTLIKVSVGYQLGGQAFSEIIFFQDRRAYEEFTSGNFEFDASASAVAITAAAQAKAGTAGASAGASITPSDGAQAPALYHKGTAVFVHTTGGLMYEASVGGQAFTFSSY